MQEETQSCMHWNFNNCVPNENHEVNLWRSLSFVWFDIIIFMQLDWLVEPDGQTPLLSLFSREKSYSIYLRRYFILENVSPLWDLLASSVSAFRLQSETFPHLPYECSGRREELHLFSPPIPAAHFSLPSPTLRVSHAPPQPHMVLMRFPHGPCTIFFAHLSIQTANLWLLCCWPSFWASP